MIDNVSSKLPSADELHMFHPDLNRTSSITVVMDQSPWNLSGPIGLPLSYTRTDECAKDVNMCLGTLLRIWAN